MAGASRSELPRRAALGVVDTWRRLNFEQRVAGVGAVLLIVSTFGPFSFVEGAIVLIALSILVLLRKRALGREFHIPFGDGTIIAAAGVWSAVLILIRIFDRPLGQGLLALACSAILFLAGISERRKRPPDDLPEDAPAHQRTAEAMAPLAEWEDVHAEQTAVREPRRRRPRAPGRRARPPRPAGDASETPTQPLPPPEYRPPGRRRSGAGRDADDRPATAEEADPGGGETGDHQRHDP